MWSKITIKLFTALVLSASFFLSLPDVCYSSAAKADPDTMIISKQDWNALMRNNAEQKKALEESQAELSAVKKAQAESEKALTEAKNLLEASQMTSDEMTKLCATLLNELSLQKAENARLTQELKDAKSESLTAYEAISKANQFLNDTREEIKAREAEWRHRENQLERQRLLWQIVSVLAIGGGVAIAS